MTLHIRYDHKCPNCNSHYIPFDNDVPCPNCGLVEGERFDFIPEAAGSLLFNLCNYGSYAPPAWWISSLADHILLLLFPVFEQFRKSSNKDFNSFVKDTLSQKNWGDEAYLEKHICHIAVRVNEHIQSTKQNVGNGQSYFT